MSDIQMTDPVKRAVIWISEEIRESPCKSMTAVLDEAAMRFNLGPQDWRFLRRFFEQNDPSEQKTF